MKLEIKPVVARLCLLGIVCLPLSAFAAASDSSSNKKLEQQVNQLERELAALKKEMHANSNSSVTSHHQVRKKVTTTSSQTMTTTSSQKAHAGYHNNATSEQIEPISGPNSLPVSGSARYFPIDIDAPGQSFVSTGPYVGVPLEYNGSNLIINNPNIDEDVALLKVRKNIYDRMNAMGLKSGEEHSHLLLSGIVEAQGVYKDLGGGPNSSDIDLSNVQLDSYVLGPSSWTSALIAFAYENDIGSQTGSISSNSRTKNSRVFVNKAYIIVGDFTKSPFYGSVGQMYVPFGTYGTSMVSSPLTKLIARTKARAINIGYHPLGDCGLYTSAYIFKGDTHAGSTSRVDNGGINLGYRMKYGIFSGNFGGGYVANIADSQGMQDTGGSPSGVFGGFGSSSTGNEKIVHRVPAYNLRARMEIGDTIDLIGEYVGATTRFNPNDLSFNGRGARPEALHTEAVYTFQTFAHPSSIGAAYGVARQALALGLPAERYSVTFNTSLWRNTLQSLEFRRDLNYAASSVATGSGFPGFTASGKADNIVTAQFDVYF